MLLTFILTSILEENVVEVRNDTFTCNLFSTAQSKNSGQ